MPSTATTRNRFEKQAAGENSNTWGAKVNTVWDMIDACLDGVEDIVTAGGSTTLTNVDYTADQAKNRVLNCTGTGGTIVIPNAEKAYLVRNASSGDVIIWTGSGTSATVKSGNIQWVFGTGSNVVYAAVITNFGSSNLSTTGTLAAGATTVTGLLDISGASSGQLKFPATQNASADANTLDDYEEGTFTPTLRFGGASVGMTFTTQAGRYTKIGRLVTIQIELILSAKGSSTGNATIGALPFTIGAVPQGSAPFLAVAMNTVAMPAAYPAASSVQLELYDFTGSTIAALTEADFNATSAIYLTLSYTV